MENPKTNQPVKKTKPRKKVKKHVDLYADIGTKLDTSAPPLDKEVLLRNLETWNARAKRINQDNIDMIMAIKEAYNNRGKVDCYWRVKPLPIMIYYYDRVNFLSRINFENKFIHDRIMTAPPRVQPTASLMQDWQRNKRDILDRAECAFVLFPPVPQQLIEDPRFVAPEGVKRPRVYLTLSHHECPPMGELSIELFTDVCPYACQLFLELCMGDGVGYGYVGTTFFRKVPQLFWAGGDVVYDNGYGCYAQRGRAAPIGAENYTFPHSMPGLLSMRMTCDDEMCGIFNITFKPLPQFDNKNVVFGRVIRPSELFNSMKTIGYALSPRPVILLSGARRKVKGVWQHGVPNTKKISLKVDRRKAPQ